MADKRRPGELVDVPPAKRTSAGAISTPVSGVPASPAGAAAAAASPVRGVTGGQQPPPLVKRASLHFEAADNLSAIRRAKSGAEPEDAAAAVPGGSPVANESTFQVDKWEALSQCKLLFDRIGDMKAMLATTPTTTRLEGAKMFCQLLSILELFPTPRERLQVGNAIVETFEALVEANVVPLMVEMLQSNVPELQLHAAHFLTLFAPGPRIATTPVDSPIHPSKMLHKGLVIVAGAVDTMVVLIATATTADAVRRRCFEGLTAVAAHNAGSRTHVLSLNVLEPLLMLTNPENGVPMDTSTLAALVRLVEELSIACGNPMQSPWSDMLQRMCFLLFQATTADVLGPLLRTLGHLMPGVAESNVAGRVVDLLTHPDPDVVLACADTVTSLVKHDVGQALVYLNANALPALVQLLAHELETVRTAAINCIAVLVSNVNPLNRNLIDTSLFAPLFHQLSNASYTLRCKCMAVLRDIAAWGSTDHINALAQPSSVKVLCTLLGFFRVHWNGERRFQLGLTRDALATMQSLLEAGAAMTRPSDPNPAVALFDEECVDNILALLIQVRHEPGAEPALYREEFLAHVRDMLRALTAGEQGTPLYDRATTLLEWYFKDTSLDTTPDNTEADEGTSLGARNMSVGSDAHVPIKCYCRGDIRTLTVPRDIPLADLQALIDDKYRRHMVLQFFDDEGDRVTIDSQDTLEMAMRERESKGQNTLKLSVYPRHKTPQYKPSRKGGKKSVGNGSSSNNSSSGGGGAGNGKKPVPKRETSADAHQKLMEQLQVQTHFTWSELESLVQQWKSQGIDENGVISPDMFSSALSRFGVEDPVLVQHAFHAFDVNGDGNISVKEFSVGLSVMLRGSVEERLEYAFRACDVDRSGYLDKGELALLFEREAMARGEDVDSEMLQSRVDALWEVIDANNDGSVSFTEFRDAILKHQLTLNVFGV